MHVQTNQRLPGACISVTFNFSKWKLNPQKNFAIKLLKKEPFFLNQLMETLNKKILDFSCTMYTGMYSMLHFNNGYRYMYLRCLNN